MKSNYFRRKQCFTILLLYLCSCSGNRIQTHDTLSTKDKAYISSLSLLDDDEKIIKFYSESRNQIAGNFFTKKRIANYWIEQRNTSKSQINNAYYSEISTIDTVYNAGLTYCPFMRITKRNSKEFNVSVEGSKLEVRGFFEDAMALWKQNLKNGKH